MRELCLSELDYVAGGLQQSSGYEDPGDPGGGGPGTPPPPSEPPPPPLISMVAPTQLVLQQFFDDLTYHVESSGQYAGSDYDHDQGADYGPPPDNWLGIPSHDPSAGAPYWSSWDGDTDPEFLQALMEGLPSQIIDGLISLPGTPLNNTVAMTMVDSGHAGAFVNGIFYGGVYHSGSSTPVTGTGTFDDPIIITSGHDGYWSFSADFSGLAQSLFPTASIPAVAGAVITATSSGINGTTGYPVGWDATRDREIDTMAQDLATKIQNKTDSTLREYSAYIWRDSSGVLHESLILIGNYNDAGATNGTSGMNPMSAYGIPAGATLVALIHNHPQFYTQLDPVNGTIISRTQNPNAQYTDTGDMNSMTFTVNHYTTETVGGVNYYRNYVVYTDTATLGMVVKEFDYTQHQTGMIPGPNVALPGAVLGNFNPAP